jgi:hypothetical protein
VEHIWYAPWTTVKALFLLNRYGTLIGQSFLVLGELGILSHGSRKIHVSLMLARTPSLNVLKPLSKRLRETYYDTLFHELFTHRGDPSEDWTKTTSDLPGLHLNFLGCPFFGGGVRGRLKVTSLSWSDHGDVCILTLLHQPASRSRKTAGTFNIPACRYGPY